MSNRASNEYGYQPKHLRENNNRLSNFISENSDQIFYILILICITIFTIVLAEQSQKLDQMENRNSSYIEENECTEVHYTDIFKDDFVYIKSIQYAIEKYEPTPTTNVYSDVEVPQTIDDIIGQDIIEFNGSTFTRYDLPDKYYPGIDYSSFQPYMPYTAITNKSAQAYWIVHSENCYTDEYGLRRYKTNDSQFTVNGEDDYVIALGNFYKEKGSAGGRYLIVTTTGMYTAIIGDEKADQHTDPMNMFSSHCNGNNAGLIEWIVDKSKLDSTIKRHGTVTAGGPEVVRGEILHIYKIN